MEIKIVVTEINEDETDVAIRSSGTVTNIGIENTLYGCIKYCEEKYPEYWYNAMNRVIDDVLGRGEDK